MGIRKHNPTTPGRRDMSVNDFSELTAGEPQKKLLAPRPRHGGRNNLGRITCRHHGGGHKRRYRIVDFKRDKYGVPGRIATIEYDPNRSAYIALVHYKDGEKRYILAPDGLTVGAEIVSSGKADIMVGNAMPLSAMGIPSSSITPRNRSRSSARSIVSGVVPRIATPACSSSRAMFRGVCPPNWQMIPIGFSFA